MQESTTHKPIQIAPSLLSADFMNLERDVRLIETAAPDWLHVDVMDGHFVPNLTVGPPLVKALKAITDIPLDVHLMVDNPLLQIDWFIEAGADSLTVHLECAGRPLGRNAARKQGTSVAVSELAAPELLVELISRIKAAGRQVGIALNPGTPVGLVLPYLDRVDLVLVMSVHPGFGGQAFIEDSLNKLWIIAEAARRLKPDLLVEVDGGINATTTPAVVAAGANLLVAGNAIFGEADPPAALAAIRAAAQTAPAQSQAPQTIPADND